MDDLQPADQAQAALKQMAKPSSSSLRLRINNSVHDQTPSLTKIAVNVQTSFKDLTDQNPSSRLNSGIRIPEIDQINELTILTKLDEAKATTGSDDGGRKYSLYDKLFHNLAIDVGPGGATERSREGPESVNRNEIIKSSINSGALRPHTDEDNQDHLSDEFEPISLSKVKNGASTTVQVNYIASYREHEQNSRRPAPYDLRIGPRPRTTRTEEAVRGQVRNIAKQQHQVQQASDTIQMSKSKNRKAVENAGWISTRVISPINQSSLRRQYVPEVSQVRQYSKQNGYVLSKSKSQYPEQFSKTAPDFNKGSKLQQKTLGYQKLRADTILSLQQSLTSNKTQNHNPRELKGGLQVNSRKPREFLEECGRDIFMQATSLNLLQSSDEQATRVSQGASTQFKRKLIPQGSHGLLRGNSSHSKDTVGSQLRLRTSKSQRQIFQKQDSVDQRSRQASRKSIPKIGDFAYSQLTKFKNSSNATPKQQTQTQSKVFSQLVPHQVVNNRNLKINERLLIKNSKYFLGSKRSKLMDQTLNKVQETEQQNLERDASANLVQQQPIVVKTLEPEAQKSEKAHDDVGSSTQDAVPPTFITDAVQQVAITAMPSDELALEGSQQFAVSPQKILSARLTTRELLNLCHEGKVPGRLRNSELEIVKQPQSKNKAEAALAEIFKKIMVNQRDHGSGSVMVGGHNISGSSKDLQTSQGQVEKKLNSSTSTDVLKFGKLRDSITTLHNKDSIIQPQSSQNLKKIQTPTFDLNQVRNQVRAPPLTSGLHSRIDIQGPPATADDSTAVRPPTTLRASENNSYTSTDPRFQFKVQNHVRIIKPESTVIGRAKINAKRSKFLEKTESWAQMLQGKRADNKVSQSRILERASDVISKETSNNQQSQSKKLFQQASMVGYTKLAVHPGEDSRNLNPPIVEHRDENNNKSELYPQKISQYRMSLKEDKSRTRANDNQSAPIQFTVNHRFTVSTVPRLVFQKRLKECHIKDEKETDLALNPLMKNYAVKTQRQSVHSRTLIVKGQRKDSNQDLPKVQNTVRNKSNNRISSDTASAIKKGQYESYGTGLLSKSDQIMQNKYDRSSKDGPRSILAKEVSIDDIPSKHKDNFVQSLIFSGQSSRIEDESQIQMVQRAADDQIGAKIENKSIISTMNLEEPAISVKRVRNKSQQLMIQRYQGTEEQNDIQIVQTMQSPDLDKQGQLVPFQHSKSSERQLELYQMQSEIQRMQLASPEDKPDAGVVLREQVEIPWMLQARSSGRQITKPSHLSNMVNSSYIMAYLDHRPYSLKPPPLKRLQNLTYRERFGFEDSGYAYRILKQWFELKNPFARLKRVRSLAEKSKTVSEQIMYNKLYLDEMRALHQYKYDHKGTRCLRAMRTEQQVDAWRRASQQFLDSLSSKKRLRSRQQRMMEFQKYMDSVIVSETSICQSQEQAQDQLQLLAPISDKLKEENQAIEEEGKSTIFQESMLQQDKAMAAFKDSNHQELHQIRRAIMNKRMTSKTHLQQSVSEANKDIFFEDQNLEYAPNQTSNSDDYTADDKQLSQNKILHQRSLDSTADLQLIQLQNMEANALQLKPGMNSDRTQFKTKFVNFDLTHRAERKSLCVDSLESGQNLTDGPFLTEGSSLSVRGQAITKQKLYIQQPNQEQPKVKERTQNNQSPNSHHFRVKIPSQVDPNQASLNATLPPKKAELKLKRNNRSQNFTFNQSFAKRDDGISVLKGKPHEGGSLKKREDLLGQQLKTPKQLRPLFYELEDNKKASAKASQFLLQGESFQNNTLKLENSQVQDSSAVNQLSNQRTLNQLLNSNKTYDLLIIGGQAILSSGHSNSPAKVKPLTPESQPEDNMMMAPISTLGTDRAAPENAPAPTAKDLSRAAAKLKSTLDNMEIKMNLKKISASSSQNRDSSRTEEIRKIRSEQKRKRQIEQDLKIQREENALQNMRKFKDKASGRMMDVKSLKPKAFVFRMYPNDSSLQTIESRDISTDNLSLIRNLDENYFQSPNRTKYVGTNKAKGKVTNSRNLPLRYFNQESTGLLNLQNSNTHGGGEIAVTDSRPCSVIIRSRSEKTQQIMVSGGVSTNKNNN